MKARKQSLRTFELRAVARRVVESSRTIHISGSSLASQHRIIAMAAAVASAKLSFATAALE